MFEPFSRNSRAFLVIYQEIFEELDSSHDMDLVNQINLLRSFLIKDISPEWIPDRVEALS